MIIIGIDPGSRFLGYGLVEKQGARCTHIENGTLYLEDKGELAQRLVHVHHELTRLLCKHSVEALAVENIFYHKNPRSMQKLAEVRGVVIFTAALRGLPVFEYSPLTVKQAVCGTGSADKGQMGAMIRVLLKLKDLAEENASDALGIAWCHAHTQVHDCPIDTAVAAGPYLRGKRDVPKQEKTMRAGTAKEILKKASFYR